MKKRGKIATIIFVVAIMLLHTFTVALASNYVTFSVTLPNKREVQTLGKGKKLTDDAYSKVKVVDGTVNYVYASVYYNGVNISEDGETVVANDADALYTKVWYNDSVAIGSGTTVTVKGYQKNVYTKTAIGRIIF